MLRYRPTEISLTAAEIERTIKRIEKRSKSARKSDPGPVRQSGPVSQSRNLRTTQVRDAQHNTSGDQSDALVGSMQSFSIGLTGDGMDTSASEADSEVDLEEDKSSDDTLSADNGDVSGTGQVTTGPQSQPDVVAQEAHGREIGQENDDVAAMTVFTEELATERVLGQVQSGADGVMDDTPPRETRLHRLLRVDGSGSNDHNSETL